MIKKIIHTVIKLIKLLMGVLVVFIMLYLPLFIIQFNLISEVHSVQETINEQRQEAFEIELTGITDTVIEINKQLDLWQGISNICPELFFKEFKELKRII